MKLQDDSTYSINQIISGCVFSPRLFLSFGGISLLGSKFQQVQMGTYQGRQQAKPEEAGNVTAISTPAGNDPAPPIFGSPIDSELGQYISGRFFNRFEASCF